MIDCPGKYCGYTMFSDGTHSICGPCPRGYRPNIANICEKCQDEPLFYDWLYMGFMALLALILNLFFIDRTSGRRRHKYKFVLHLSAAVEFVVSVLCSVLVMEPIGRLSLTSCRVQALSDWYTMLHNPSPNYTATLHCTQEVVYPQYTIPMVFYGFCLVTMMIIRPFIAVKFVPHSGSKCIYAALYFLPTLTLIQAVAGGLIYYSFPYIVVIGSLITLAIHMTRLPEQDAKSLIKDNITSTRNAFIVIGHWLLHAYGIMAITELKDLPLHASVIALVPFPTLFYVLTAKFTLPEE